MGARAAVARPARGRRPATRPRSGPLGATSEATREAPHLARGGRPLPAAVAAREGASEAVAAPMPNAVGAGKKIAGPPAVPRHHDQRDAVHRTAGRAAKKALGAALSAVGLSAVRLGAEASVVALSVGASVVALSMVASAVALSMVASAVALSVVASVVALSAEATAGLRAGPVARRVSGVRPRDPIDRRGVVQSKKVLRRAAETQPRPRQSPDRPSTMTSPARSSQGRLERSFVPPRRRRPRRSLGIW